MERATAHPSAPNGDSARAAAPAHRAAPGPHHSRSRDLPPAPPSATRPGDTKALSTGKHLSAARKAPPVARCAALALSLLVMLVFDVIPPHVRGGELPALPSVSTAPDQGHIAEPAAWTLGSYRVTAMATYDVTARVLSRADYSTGREAEVSAVDLALGWGPMADRSVLEQMVVRQRDRWYFVNWQKAPLSVAEIISNSANTHILAAPMVAERLAEIRQGDLVRLRGYLVQVRAEDGWTWRSSLTREDTGDGSCEVLWVEEVEIFHDAPITYAGMP